MFHRKRAAKYTGKSYSGLAGAHNDSPAGGGGPGGFRNAVPLGINSETDSCGPVPGVLGLEAYFLGDSSSVIMPGQFGVVISTPAAMTGDSKDPVIEALDLSDKAKKAAYRLKAKFSTIVFTSGRRDKAAQARAMASNVVLNRKWIKQTYHSSEAIKACQKWVDEHPEKKTKTEIAAGLKSVFDGLTDKELAKVSKHLSGDAFDVQPVTKDDKEIKKMLRELTKETGGKFLDKEGGLVRWHAQF